MPELIKKSYISWVSAPIFAIILSASFVVALGHASYDVDGLRLGFGVAPARHGQTELAIPPFGEVTAMTHTTPVRLTVTFERIYPDEISQVATTIDDSEQLVQKIESEGKKAFKQFIILLMVLATLGGLLGAIIFPGRRVLKAVAGALVGAIFVGGLLAGTYYSYDIYAFKQPRYTGALTVAPWATEEVAKRLADIKAFRQEIRTIARNVNNFYTKIDSWQPIQENTIKVLHVSDIHNNPAAVDLIKRVVRDFKVDFVIDTGDITDFGTPVETKLIEGIASLPVPYVYVAGNHDSPETAAFMRGAKNVVVLGDRPVVVEGIKIVGIPDPSSTTFDVGPASDETLTALRASVTERIESLPEKPLILAVHNPKVARGLVGKVPIILAGHTHKAQLIEKNGGILNNAGTTGGAGLRTFQHEEGLPYTLNLLHIERSPQRLVAIDSLAMMGSEQEFRLERNLIKATSEGKLPLRAELGTRTSNAQR